MSTRRAKDDSVFHQSRYASSAEFERGLLANLVAKRCALIEAAADRELIWFIQYVSHQVGGLAAVVRDIISKYPDQIQTAEMSAMKLKLGKICSADQVRKLRIGFKSNQDSFILKGETYDHLYGCCEPLINTIAERGLDLTREDVWLEEKQAADKHPNNYPSGKFFEVCLAVANEKLERDLCELCLNPESVLLGGPWYFPGLVDTLRQYKTEFERQKRAGFVITALGQKVCDTLDYTAYIRGLTLMQGEARTGKSFSARAWCEQRPGLARFVEVPPSNDETSFFRALASGLGLGNFINYKACEVRARVESVLRNGDILLVLDEAQRLWPQRNLRYGFPGRIVWVMTMANAGIPIAMISTPQFVQIQKAVEKTGWNSAQLTGRTMHFESLPVDLSAEDLMAVAKSVLPEAAGPVLRALAIYARSSARYLAAIESISKRARYIAMRAGRATATTDDVRRAMQESVIPADTKLQSALAAGKKAKTGDAAAPEPISAPAPDLAPAQDSLPDPARLRSGSAPALFYSTAPARTRGEVEAVLNGH